MKGERKHFPASKRLRFRVERFVIRGVAWLLPKFPRSFVLRLGRLLGWLSYRLPGHPDDHRAGSDAERDARRNLCQVARTLRPPRRAESLRRDHVAQNFETRRQPRPPR